MHAASPEDLNWCHRSVWSSLELEGNCDSHTEEEKIRYLFKVEENKNWEDFSSQL